MRKVLSFVISTAVAVSFLSGISSSVAGAENMGVTNYGTSDALVFGSDKMANIKVTDPDDPDAGYLNDLNFELYDTEGNKAAEWTGNDSSSFSSLTDSVTGIRTSGRLSITEDLFESLSKDEIIVRNKSLKEVGKGHISSFDGKIYANFGKEYELKVTYLIDHDSELIIPANMFGVYADSEWKSRSFQWSFSLGKYNNPEKYEVYVPLYTYSFNENAGKLNLQTLEKGEYPYCLHNTPSNSSNISGVSGNGSRKIVIDDTPHEYFKVTFNLYELYPNYFNEDGTYNYSFFGDTYLMNFAKDSSDPVQSAGLVFLSGNVLTAPIPDEKGNVSIYVDKATQTFDFMTDFSVYNGGGGGSTGGNSICLDYTDTFSFRTMQPDSEGVNIYAETAGKYKVKAQNMPDGYEIISGDEFEIKEYGPLAEGASYTKDEIQISKIKRKASLEIKGHGNVVTGTSFSEKIPKNERIELTAAADEGYVFDEYIIYDSEGKRLPESVCRDSLDKTVISLFMPGEDITICVSFIKHGDANGDDNVNIMDLVKLKKMILLADTDCDDACKRRSDINSDGKINMFDFIRLENMLLSKEK